MGCVRLSLFAHIFVQKRDTESCFLLYRALKLRYELPILTPNVPVAPQGHLTPGETTTPLASPQPSAQRFPSMEPPIVFDATVIARKEDGWEAMLEQLALRWAICVVDERRGKEIV